MPKATFGYLSHFAWRRVARWLRNRDRGLSWGTLRRRFLLASSLIRA